jgi:Tol biopolymer transport system component/DNA-binding winged helix-turn-helix (wHTH) protein
MATGEAPARQNVLRFGEFELDLDRQTLSRRGIRLKLQNQPYQVLALLIRRAPEVVARDEIRQRVWGNDVYIDTERSINFCIRQIRGVLLDSAASPRFIETLPREGYRFIAPLEGVVQQGRTDHSSVPTANKEIPDVPVRPNRHRWAIVSIAFAALLTVAAVAFWILRPEVQVRVSGVSPVTSYPGDEREPSLSPDGRQVAFSWDGEDARRHIYVKLLGEERPLRLTQDPADDSFPAWSPDGKQIAFMRRRTDSESEIMLIPSIGGPERTLRQVQIGEMVSGSGRMMSWSADGKWLCFTSELGPSSRHALFLLFLGSGSVRPFFARPANAGGDSSPAFSPDGHWLAFARYSGPANSEIFVQRVTAKLEPAGEPQLVLNTSGNSTTPVWLSDSKRILFLGRDGTRIMQAQIGGAAKLAYIAGASLSGLAINGSGSRLVASRRLDDDDIWSLPVNGLRAAGEAKRFVYSTANESQPRFSPDGRLLAFKSNRSGASEVWLADSDGRNPRQLTYTGAYIVGYPRWSPDSNFLVFHARLSDEAQVYTIRVKDGVTRQITHERPGFFTIPILSLDGKVIYMTETHPEGPMLSQVSAAGGTPQPLWSGCCASEVPGRSLLVYGKLEQPGIYGRSLSGDVLKNAEIRLVKDYVPPGAGFEVVDDGIYYIGCTPTGQPRAFRFYSFASGQSVDIAPTPLNYAGDLAVAPDRQRLAYTTAARGSQDLVQLDLN